MGTKATLECPIEATWFELVTPEDDEGEGAKEYDGVGPDDSDSDDEVISASEYMRQNIPPTPTDSDPRPEPKPTSAPG